MNRLAVVFIALVCAATPGAAEAGPGSDASIVALLQAPPTTEGTRLRTPDGAIYIMHGGKRRLIPTWPTYLAMGLETQPRVETTASAIAPIPEGPPIPNDAVYTPVKGSGPEVYLLQSGTKRLIPNWSTFLALGLTAGDVVLLPDAALAAIANGAPVQDLGALLPVVRRFAPVLRFDQDGKGYPMSAQTYYKALVAKNPQIFGSGERSPGIEQATLDKAAPTYYQVLADRRQVRIRYWWYYGMQHACNLTPLDKSGRHHGDWEAITVILREDRGAVAAVNFEQHGGSYTRIAGPRDATCNGLSTVFGGKVDRCGGPRPIELVGERPVVYVGRQSHGSFHAPNDTLGDQASMCSYFHDYRRPTPATQWDTSTGPLVPLDVDAEPWMAVDRKGAILWGPPDDPTNSRGEGGVTSRPTTKPPDYNMRACKGSEFKLIADSGCLMSECLAGDDSIPGQCLKECEPGYVNFGGTCNQKSWPFKIYPRRGYAYDYVIPSRDIGLSRRRASAPEYQVPERSGWDCSLCVGGHADCTAACAAHKPGWKGVCVIPDSTDQAACCGCTP